MRATCYWGQGMLLNTYLVGGTRHCANRVVVRARVITLD